MKEFDEMFSAWTEFCAKIEPLLPKKEEPAAEPEPDPRLTWDGIKDSDGDRLRIVVAEDAGSVIIHTRSTRTGQTTLVRADAAMLWELAKAAASAAMALEGMDEPEEPVEKLPGVGPLEHYRTWAWLNLDVICRKQEGGE
jgi:hypothetical protein